MQMYVDIQLSDTFLSKTSNILILNDFFGVCNRIMLNIWTFYGHYDLIETKNRLEASCYQEASFFSFVLLSNAAISVIPSPKI